MYFSLILHKVTNPDTAARQTVNITYRQKCRPPPIAQARKTSPKSYYRYLPIFSQPNRLLYCLPVHKARCLGDVGIDEYNGDFGYHGTSIKSSWKCLMKNAKFVTISFQWLLIMVYCTRAIVTAPELRTQIKCLVDNIFPLLCSTFTRPSESSWTLFSLIFLQIL